MALVDPGRIVAGAPSRVRRRGLRRLARVGSPVTAVGVLLVGTLVVVAIAAPLLAPYSPTEIDLDGIRAGSLPGPSAEHWLGVDPLGRDLLSRLIYGTRTSLVIAVAAVAVGLVGGVTLGGLAGALGGWVDVVTMRIVDVMLSVPGLLFAIAVAAMLGPSLRSVILALGIVNIPIFARLLRSSILSERSSPYVEACRAMGLSELRIVWRHVLPNSLGPLTVAATLALATAIVDAAGLAFLGLSSPDPAIPEWGKMLAETQSYLSHAPHLAMFPGAVITLSVLGFYLVGEALQERLDPRLKDRS
ncbi:ABC transporter permease [Nocardioides sp. L-11A]|uniref:ABC transporter permease n=1 Tax=Nocardioides sp. L-11A TaxID=3043848 RepID=UPI00249B3698|nr:ABC transporter permease [Nocardioides sp. L-11A]